MKKRLMRCMMLALCLCLLLTGSVTTMAASGELIEVSGGTDGGVTQVPGDDGSGGTPPAPEPEKEAKYTITIAAPHGWYTKSATATIKLEDVNGTGFEKADAKIGTNGSWQDISDSLRSYGWAHIELSDNATVYVTVTDKKGKAHVKSLYIECFDRDAPTVRAKIEGRMLRVEADDSLSGVEYVYINGYRLDDLTNGTLDVRVKEYADEDEQDIYVQSVDYAGNKSKTVSVKNPYYVSPSSSKADTSQSSSSPAPAPASSSAPAEQAPAASAPASSAASPAASQPAASAPVQASNAPAQAEQPAASENADNGSVTPTDGTGTVIENSVKTSNQREFFTISTEAGNDYYIVVDKEKADKNVYLLSEVTEDDLTGLAKPSTTEHAVPDNPEPTAPVVTPTPEPDPADKEQEPENEPAPKKTADTGTILIMVVVVLAVGVAGWYFKIYKPKQDAYEDEGEDWGDEGTDEDSPDEDSADEYDIDGEAEDGYGDEAES